MKVSVIIPVYNVEKYLRECVDSVLSQTHKQFEVILVDDGSTDGSGTICDEYAERCSCVSVIHSTNKGPFFARNLGAHIAQGDIVVFLDSDDCLRTDALEILADCFLRTQCDMVLYDSGICPNFSSYSVHHPFQHEEVFSRDRFEMIIRLIVSSRIPNSLCLKAVRKNCAQLKEDALKYSHVKQGEDLLMSIFFIDNCEKIAYLPEELYFYRMRQGSAVHTYDPMRKESVKTVHQVLAHYLDRWNMKELKPMHNARKVRGWVDVLGMLMKNKQHMDKNVYRHELDAMAEDNYFRSAYLAADMGQLSGIQKLSARWLYQKNYFALHILVFLRRIRSSKG